MKILIQLIDFNAISFAQAPLFLKVMKAVGMKNTLLSEKPHLCLIPDGKM